MSLISINTERDYVNWSDCFQLLSLDRLAFLYPMIGMPRCVIVNPSSLNMNIKEYLLSQEEFRESDFTEFQLVQIGIDSLLSKIDVFYNSKCMVEVVNWFSYFQLNEQEANCLFFWSLIFRKAICFKERSISGQGKEIPSKVNSIITLEKYQEDQSSLRKFLYSASLTPMTSWENWLSERSSISEDDIFRDDFPTHLTPYIVGRLSMIDILAQNYYHYHCLNKIRSALSTDEADIFLDLTRQLIDEEEFSAAEIFYPSI